MIQEKTINGIRPDTERGPWLATASGFPWYILDPRPEEVRIVDIAAGLSRACRYNGQLREDFDFLAVSEHSVDMTEWALENGVVQQLEDALALLLHDGSESIYGDMVTPIKEMMPNFRTLEGKAQTVIMDAFGLNAATVGITYAQIKIIDRRIRLDERAAALEEPARTIGIELSWEDDPQLKPLGIDIKGLNPREARMQFLECFIACCENLPLRNPELGVVLSRHLEDARAHVEYMKNPPPSRPIRPMPQAPSQSGPTQERNVLFPVKDPFDNMDQATLRNVCFTALKRIEQNRQDFMKSCDNRACMSEASDADRRLNFGVQLMGAFILGRNRMMPGIDAEAFIRNLSNMDTPASERAGGLLSRIFKATPNNPPAQVKERMLPILASWPQFNHAAYAAGAAQPKEFMEEFKIDYAGLREMTFECRKPLEAMLQMESHIEHLRPIFDAFQRSAFSNISLEMLSEKLNQTEQEPDPNLEPAM